MKKVLRKYSAALLGLIFFVSSCTDESTFPLPLSELQGSGDRAGAYARILSYTQNTFDFFSLDEDRWGFRFEGVDSRGGELIERVEVVGRFIDNTPQLDADGEEIPGTNLTTQFAPIITITRAQMTETSQRGFPVGSWELSLPAIASAIGIDMDEINGFDYFVFEWTLFLTTGQSFDSRSVGLNVAGPFYNSPFFRRVNVICALTDGFAEGDYSLQQAPGGPQDPFFGSGNRFASRTVTLEKRADAASTQRFFAVNYITFANRPFFIDLLCGSVLVPDQPSGLGCGGGPLRWASGATLAGFDAFDDSVIPVTFVDDHVGGCGLTAPVTFVLTKQ
jgi:hypothetical protein